jgi:hypothetical protein
MGVSGSDAFFQTFIEHVLHKANWEQIHAMVLAGPLLWALAWALNRRQLSGPSRPWLDAGMTAMTIGAGCWVLTFVFDGFAAPYLAKQWSHAIDASSAYVLLSTFGANQTIVIRAGLVSWLMISVANAMFGMSLLPDRDGRALRSGRMWLAITGIILGALALVLWMTGSFRPGPFTSPWWNPHAIATAVWSAWAGVECMRSPAGKSTAAIQGKPEPAPSR